MPWQDQIKEVSCKTGMGFIQSFLPNSNIYIKNEEKKQKLLKNQGKLTKAFTTDH